MVEYNNIREKNFTYLGKGSSLKGDITLSGHINIASAIVGTVRIEQGGKLVIDREGSLEGDLYGEDIEIFGAFNGRIFSTGKVILRPSALVYGQIEATTLAIYPGAFANIQGQTKTYTH